MVGKLITRITLCALIEKICLKLIALKKKCVTPHFPKDSKKNARIIVTSTKLISRVRRINGF